MSPLSSRSLPSTPSASSRFQRLELHHPGPSKHWNPKRFSPSRPPFLAAGRESAEPRSPRPRGDTASASDQQAACKLRWRDACRERRGWREKCLRIFRDSYSGEGVNDDRLIPTPANGGGVGMKRTAEGNRASGGSPAKADQREAALACRVAFCGGVRTTHHARIHRKQRQGNRTLSVPARRVAGRPKSVATAGAGLFGLEATRGCAGKGNV